MLYQSLFLLVALFLSAVSASVTIPLQSCSSGSDIVSINSATANVWPPVKGEEFTVDLSATVAEAINGGTYELKVAFDSIPLLDKTGPLTDLNITFPIKAGPITLSKSVQFPNIPISGSIDITIQAKDSNGNEIVCEKISLNLSTPKKQVEVTDVQIPYTSCAGASDLATLSEVTANAWPPVKGSDLIITVHGTLSKAVNNGTYEIKASFDGIPILDQKGALSALTTLPLAAGAFSVSKTQNLPSIIPSGKIDITITATSDDGTEILCIKVEVNLSEPRPVATKVTDVQIPYTSCAGTSDLATLSEVTANAWPPVKGSDLIITVHGTLSKAVNNGTYEIKASFDGIPILDQKGALSALTTLPLAAGAFSVSKTQNLPSIIPSGKIDITITAASDDGTEILCIKVEVNLSEPVPIAVKVTDTPVPYSSCGSSSDIATLSSVTANEWPPQKNSDLSITANGNLNKDVNNGTYEIKAKFDGIQILKKHGELSDLVTLPLSAGPISIVKSVHLPKSIPSGKIEIEVTASSDDGSQILCFKVSVHMKSPAPIAPIAPIVPSRIAVKNHYPIIVSPFKVYSNVAVPFKSCGSSDDLFPITAVSATSWPPVSGSTIEMTSVFDAKSVINGGTYRYKAEYLGIVVQDKTDTLAAAGYQLPINPGAYTITQSVNAPAGLPPGHITTTTSATDENGKALFCFVIEFDV